MKYWLYYTVKSLMEIPFRVFFKSLHFEGLENIPKGKPILFMANHSGSFLDGGLLEYTQRIKVFSLARGDAFNKPIFNKLLRSMLILPIFRARDADPEKARIGNERTYNECYELFKKGNRILIFPEASSVPEKTLRPLKKGGGNIAADVMMRSKGELDLYVVPCGINFSHFGRNRIRVHLIYGKAISIKERFGEIKADPRKFGVTLTNEVEKVLAQLVVKTSGALEEEKEFVHQLAINEFDDHSRYRHYNTGAAQIPGMVDRVTSSNKTQIDAYEELLKTSGVKDRNVSRSSMNIMAMLLAVCTLAVSLPAAILYKVVWVGAKHLADRMVKNVLFYDSIYFGMGLIGSIVWYIILFIVAFAVLPEQWTTMWQSIGLIAALAGAPAWFNTVEELKHFYFELRYYSLGKKRIQKIRKLRQAIIDSVRS